MIDDDEPHQPQFNRVEDQAQRLEMARKIEIARWWYVRIIILGWSVAGLGACGVLYVIYHFMSKIW